MNKASFQNFHFSLAGTLYKLSISAKFGCVILSLFFMLSFLFNPMNPLALTPGYIIPPNFWIWTVVTHIFIETRVAMLTITCAALIVAGNVLEPKWGTVKLLIYYAIVGITSGVLCGCFYLALYICTFNTIYLFNIHLYGSASVIAGILVAIKQKSSETMLIGSIGLYVRDIPLLYISVATFLSLLTIIRSTILPMSLFGTLVSWIYLRFYENNSRGRGDPSEHFAFKCFFPKVLQGPIGKITGPIYKFLLKVKICRKAKYRYDVGAPGNITLTLGVNALDAERRRNRAIKALDEHLKKSAEVSQASWPSLDDDEESALPKKHSNGNKDLESSNASSGEGSMSPDIVTIDMKEIQNGNISSS